MTGACPVEQRRTPFAFVLQKGRKQLFYQCVGFGNGNILVSFCRLFSTRNRLCNSIRSADELIGDRVLPGFGVRLRASGPKSRMPASLPGQAEQGDAGPLRADGCCGGAR
jgi:hypothetical protein